MRCKGWSWLAIFTLLGGIGSAADWPQRQRDPQRTGYSPEPIRPPFRSVWFHYYPDDEQRVHPWVQPIIARGRVFVATLEGRIYAHDAATGKVLWKPVVGGPFLHTGAWHEGRAIFASLDGHVYAVNEADGTLLWKFYADRHGFEAGILVADGKVFAAARSGTLYALDPATGRLLWTFRTEAPVLNTPAYNDGRVYVADEGIHLYAVDARTGRQIWKSERLFGVTAQAYHPVVTAGKVFLRTYNAAVDWRFPLEKVDARKAEAEGRYPPIPDAITEEAFAFYEQKPYARNLYAFDEKTGRLCPVLHNCGGTNAGMSAPPCVDRDGLLVLCVCAMHETGNLFLRVDPRTGRGVDLLWWPSWGNMGTVDEQQEQSAAGDLVFTVQSEWYEVGVMGAFDLRRPAMFSTKSKGESGWKVHCRSAMSGLDFNMDESSHPFAIAEGRLFKIGANALVAFEAAREEGQPQ